MPAVLRIGGELEPGYQSGYAIGGTWDSGSVSLIAGRTGGRAWRCVPHYSGGGSFTGGALIGGQPDHPNPAHIPQAEEDQWVIGRVYARINQYPVITGDAVPGFVTGLPIMTLYPASRGVALLPDGTIGATGSFTGSQATAPDRPVQLPLNEWVMIESAATHSLTAIKQVIRVTLPGEDPVIVFCRSRTLGQHEPTDDMTPSITLGIDADPGAGFVLDLDDAGINLGGDDAHGTWLGPGSVRNARPSGDLGIGEGFEPRGINGTLYALNITRVNHGIDPLMFSGPYISVFHDFSSTLANDPIRNPATDPETNIREKGKDYEISSAGADYHEHTSPPAPVTPDFDGSTPQKEGYVVVYDQPRKAEAGETLEVECDASDQTGAISYALPWVIGTQMEALTDPFTQDEAQTGFMAFYGGWETPPTAGDETDRAVQNLDDYWGTGGAVDSAWTTAYGRISEDPALGTTPALVIRREDATLLHAEGEGPFLINNSEFRLIGAGIVYESGFEPQPPIEPCRRLMTFV